MDKAGKQYWNMVWKNGSMPNLFSVNSDSFEDYYYIQFHKLFQRLFQKLRNRSKTKIRVLEIGCANSIWPVYFYKIWGCDVYGMDYSEIGCKIEKKIFEKYGIDESNVILSDFFTPPENLINTFDLVVSFGVIEHFDNTSNVLSAFSRYLKPGGVLFTEIPNLKGIPGFIVRVLNNKVYNVHNPLDCSAIINAHNNTGMKIKECNYYIFFHLSVINIENLNGTLIYKILRKIGMSLTRMFFYLQKRGIKLKPNKLTSPYLYCFSEKTKR